MGNHGNMLSKHIAMALGLAAAVALAPTAALAQSSTATIRGHVTNAPAQASGEVVATNVNTGFAARVPLRENGTYTLAGLSPGTYRIDATANGTHAVSQTVTVQIGQSLVLDLDGGVASAAPANAANLEGVTVSANSLIETRTSEVASNITTQQIRDLPQNSRNFLNFAGLTPGISTPKDKNSKSFSAGGQPSNQTNVFIDGANLKNNILQGGLVGQDGSRGNPFSQEAIQEFRVLTQNYKAEYEQAGTAIVSAVTKSGTNEFHGSVYDFLQTRGMVTRDEFSRQVSDQKPAYRRQQYGASLGGPIIKDKLQFFINFEGNKEDANKTVFINNPTYADRFAQYNGTFAAPFDEKVYFGKLSWHPDDKNDVDLSYSNRKDKETINFGGTTAYDGRQERLNKVTDLLLKWQYRGDAFVNELLLDRGDYKYNPHPVNPDIPSQNFIGIAQIGGSSSVQQKQQNNFTLRDDVTFDDVNWHGQHVIKTGIKIATVNQHLLENNSSTPQYSYRPDSPNGLDIPYSAVYSPDGKTASLKNKQYGIYVQDDWDVTDRLQLNLGVRWDYETNATNRFYVTPDDQAAVVRALGLPDSYISNGHNRSAYKGEVQPRLGFSLDVSPDADQSTTVFGGAGRYYDRTPYDNIIQESFHAQFPYYNFFFSANGAPNLEGNSTTVWQPQYLTRAGLDGLIQGGNAGGGEIDLLNNKTKPPYTDQFSLGVRQTMGDWVGSLTLSRLLGYRQFTWIFGNRPAPDYTSVPVGAYNTVLINTTKKYTSSSVLIGIDKPYTDASGWGVGIAYTYTNAKKQGNDAYSLDYATPGAYPWGRTAERNRLVINGTVKLPWDIKLSTLITLGSGDPYDVAYGTAYNDPNRGPHIGAAAPKKGNFIIPNAWGYRDMDLALSKTFNFGGTQALEIRADAFNVFNFKNYGCYTTLVTEPNFGQPACIIGVTRSYQVGARYSF